MCKYERMSPRMGNRTRPEGQDNARQPVRLPEYECVARRSWRSGTRTARRPMHKTLSRGAIGVSREGDTSLSREGGSNECPQRGSNRSNTSSAEDKQPPTKSRHNLKSIVIPDSNDSEPEDQSDPVRSSNHHHLWASTWALHRSTPRRRRQQRPRRPRRPSCITRALPTTPKRHRHAVIGTYSP